MKKIIYFLIIFLTFFFTFKYKENILVYYNKYYNENKNIASSLINNEYVRDYNFNYVNITDDFYPKEKNDIINIFYTIINSGMEEFTFYCSDEYTNCITDIKDIANNQIILSNINNFVHPYNGFKSIETEVDSLGKITIKITHNYTDEMKIILNYKIKEIIKENITDDMSLEEKIKVIHDYIINNTKYDIDRSNYNIINYKSDTAYGALIEGYALCSGYTDSMMLFLEEFNIKSYKIASSNHIWNYVNLNNNWYHLDLTWDDPISNEDKDILQDTFLLINDLELEKLNTTEHIYDKNVYSE